MPGVSGKWTESSLTPEEQALRDDLSRTITALATDIGERNVHRAPDGLVRAEQLIQRALAGLGFTVQREAFTVDDHEVANLFVEHGSGDELVVVGAHYDTAYGTPGADDNASGVAALLALASRLPARPMRKIRLVAFTNEEPPWFHGPDMGSRHHARNARAREERIVAMLSLETLGLYRTEAGSQAYPKPFSLLYPSEGNFLAFVGNPESLALVRRTTRVFREHQPDLPSEGASLPAAIQGVGWSDHRSFWERGYPAVMVTDTAPNRNPHYHETTDRPETLDLDALTRAVVGLTAVLEDLAMHSAQTPTAHSSRR
jgi:hypothetical protein